MIPRRKMVTIPVTRIYTGCDDRSYFEDTEVPLSEMTSLGQLSKLISAKGVLFRQTEPGQDLDWHNAPCRQFVVLLSGPDIEIEIGDGTVRNFAAGSVLLVEDTTGQGHISRVTDSGEARTSLFIPLT